MIGVRITVLICLALLGVGQSFGGGDYSTRLDTGSNFGRCEKPMVLRERMLSGANTHNIWQVLAVACMSGAKVAKWVVLAAVDCGELTQTSVPVERCLRRMTKVPVVDPKFLAAGPNAAGREDYSLVSYGAGADCTIHAVSDDQAAAYGDGGGWACARVGFIDGTRMSNGHIATDASQLRVGHYWTYGGRWVGDDFSDSDSDPLPIDFFPYDAREDFDMNPFVK